MVIIASPRLVGPRTSLAAAGSEGRCRQGHEPLALDKDPDTFEGYQAVLLDDNQVYFGKASGLGTDYAVLTDVFYFRPW
jgi:hypothetical protein